MINTVRWVQACCDAHAHRREVALLRGESLGLQDVLAESGAEAAARAAQLAQLEAQLGASLARLRQAR